MVFEAASFDRQDRGFGLRQSLSDRHCSPIVESKACNLSLERNEPRLAVPVLRRDPVRAGLDRMNPTATSARET
jgi:hypothetical protein